jgi:hypothetical protein
MNKWINGLAVDAVIFGCFYLWQVEHIASAKSFVTFAMWATAVLLWLGVFIGKAGGRKRVTFYTVYAFASTAATIGLMVWSDMAACAITYFLAWLFAQAKISAATEKTA